MEKRVIAVFSIILMASLLSLSVVSAVWWNPFTWFQKNAYFSPEENLTETNSSVPSNQTPINTAPACTPNCAGKTCGNNGCGGVCGTCASERSCIDGNCVFCIDSDNGQNFNVSGTTQNSTATLTDSCSGSILSEKYCSGNWFILTKIVNCSNGCSNGACVISSVLTNTTTPAKKEIVTCQKQYQTAWSASKCNSADCGKDKYKGCRSKIAWTGRWIQRQYREICQNIYNTTCMQNPTCSTGYNKISKFSC